MKKIIITTIAGIIMATIITGCGGKEEKLTKVEHDNVDPIIIEEIRVETIQVEEIRVEEIQTESTKVECIDDEYNNELEYNSKVNTYWDNNENIKYW